MNIIKYNDIILHVPNRYYHSNLKNRFIKKIYEKEETYIAKKYFNNNDYVLEIGSCLGYVTSILSKKCKYVISIEGNPELKESLEITKKKNKLLNVDFINGYIDNKEKIIEFQTYDNIVAGSGDREDLNINNVRGWGNTLKTYNIKTILLNNIKNYNKINALMLDMEGGEYLFLKNYSDFIKKNIKKICVELHGHLMSDKQFDKKCLTEINKMGFKLIQKVGISYYFEK